MCGGQGLIPAWEKGAYIDAFYGEENSVTHGCMPCPYCNGGIDYQIQETRKNADIPASFFDSDMAAFDWSIYIDRDKRPIDTSDAARAVNSFITRFRDWESRGVGLYIYSRVRGSGKTFLASCICNELIGRYSIKTKFVSCADLIAIEKSGHDSVDEYERDPILRLCKCKLLVLDDFGQKKTGENWVNDILFRILDYRITNNRLTIITSNIPYEEYSGDTRISSRIDGNMWGIHLPEFSVRSSKAMGKKIELAEAMGLFS